MSPPLLSNDWISTPSCFSLSRFNSECATDLSSSSSAAAAAASQASSAHWPSCWFVTLAFQRRFTRLVRRNRNIKHGQSRACRPLSSGDRHKRAAQKHSTIPPSPTPTPSPSSTSPACLVVVVDGSGPTSSGFTGLPNARSAAGAVRAAVALHEAGSTITSPPYERTNRQRFWTKLSCDSYNTRDPPGLVHNGSCSAVSTENRSRNLKTNIGNYATLSLLRNHFETSLIFPVLFSGRVQV